MTDGLPKGGPRLERVHVAFEPVDPDVGVLAGEDGVARDVPGVAVDDRERHVRLAWRCTIGGSGGGGGGGGGSVSKRTRLGMGSWAAGCDMAWWHPWLGIRGASYTAIWIPDKAMQAGCNRSAVLSHSCRPAAVEFQRSVVH